MCVHIDRYVASVFTVRSRAPCFFFFFFKCVCLSGLLCWCCLVLLLGRVATAVLLCHYCPCRPWASAATSPPSAAGTSAAPPAGGVYGLVHVLALQRLHVPGGLWIEPDSHTQGPRDEITYTCCCRNLCNTATTPQTYCQQLLGVTVSPWIHRAVRSSETHTHTHTTHTHTSAATFEQC